MPVLLITSPPEVIFPPEVIVELVVTAPPTSNVPVMVVAGVSIVTEVSAFITAVFIGVLSYDIPL